MPIVQAYHILIRYPYIVIQPIIIDIILLAILFGTQALTLTSESSSRVLMAVGMPSMFHLFSLPFSWFLFVAILLWSFGQGGYIRSLIASCTGTTLSMSQLMKANMRYGLPFLFLQLAMMLATSAVMALLILFFGTIGLGAGLLFFLVFRVLLIYLEFTMVTDRLSFDTALRRAFQTLKQHWPPSIAMAVSLLIFSGMASLLVNRFHSPPMLIGYLIIYDVLMSVFLLALMLTYMDARKYEG